MNLEDHNQDAAYEAHMEQQAAEPYYTPTQAARILGMSDRWVRKELAEGRMQGEQTETGRWRIPTQVVDERRERDRRLALTNEAPQTVSELSDQLIELAIELGRTQARLHMAEQRAAQLEHELQQEQAKGSNSS